MTMVHIATKAISRKAGQSAVASAAYRAGDVLDDAKYGKTYGGWLGDKTTPGREA